MNCEMAYGLSTEGGAESRQQGRMGGLMNPRPWCGRCRAGLSDAGGPPLPRKRAPKKQNRRGKTTSKIPYLL